MFKNYNISKFSDEELLLSYKESDNNRFLRELFNRYLPLLYGVCLKYLNDTDKAHDAVMQLFESLPDKVGWSEINEFRPWIYRISKNYCLQILRKEEQSIAEDFDNNVPELDHIIDLLEKNDSEQSLKDCINKLPEQQRLSITYFFRNKLSYAEIVDKTGYTLQHVKSYILMGKQSLKNCLENTD